MPNIRDEGIDITGKCNCSRHFKKVVLIANKYKVYYLESGDAYCQDADICAKCGAIIGYDEKTVQRPDAQGNTIRANRCPACSEVVNISEQGSNSE